MLYNFTILLYNSTKNDFTGDKNAIDCRFDAVFLDHLKDLSGKLKGEKAVEI